MEDIVNPLLNPTWATWVEDLRVQTVLINLQTLWEFKLVFRAKSFNKVRVVEFFILEDLKPLLSQLYTLVNSMGGSSSKEPEKAPEVGPPTKQMKDWPTINTQGGLHLFSMTGSPAGALLIGSLFVLSLLVGYKVYRATRGKQERPGFGKE